MSKIMARIKYTIGAGFFKITGWRCDRLPKELGNRFVLIGFPHTSNIDAPIGVAFSFINQMQASPMLKKEWMFWPMSVIFKAMHVIPIDRGAKTDVVGQLVGEFKARDNFIPFIFPEGTRKNVNQIKTGFWHIADQAGVPIAMLFKDFEERRIRYMGHIHTSGDKRADLLKIREIFQTVDHEVPVS